MGQSKSTTTLEPAHIACGAPVRWFVQCDEPDLPVSNSGFVPVFVMTQPQIACKSIVGFCGATAGGDSA